MAGVITTGNHPKALWPGIKAWWGRAYGEHATEYTDLFTSDTSTQSYEEDVGLTGFGLATIKPQGSALTYDTESQGFVQRYSHVTYGLGYIVSMEEMQDNLYSVVSKRRSRANAFSMRQTKELVGANVYNRAVNSSYTGGDGVVLLSASHPTKSGNQSNILGTAADLSQSSIEDLCIQIMGAVNERNLKINLIPQSLHVHRNDWFLASKIYDTTKGEAFTGDNTLNVLNAQNIFPKGVKMNHYFTDTDAWFVRTNCPDGMKHYQRMAIEFGQDNDFDTKNAKAAAIERYVFGWTDWRGVYGSEGA